MGNFLSGTNDECFVVGQMWPALWFTKTSGWSAEIDVLEWNGDGNISYNVYNVRFPFPVLSPFLSLPNSPSPPSQQVGWNQINVPWPAGFHNVTCQVRNINNKDLTVTWWQDGAQVAKNERYQHGWERVLHHA